MLNIEEVTSDVLDQAEKLGFIVEPTTFESEHEAEVNGFYWYDEITKWVNVDKVKSLI